MEEINTLNRIDLEYAIHTSPHLLYNRLSTPSGLAEWFADDVNLSGKIFTFIWEGAQLKAEVVEKKENKSIKFRWLKEEGNPKNFFAFKILTHELSGELTLQVIELLDEYEDIEEATSLWNYQIGKLKRILGI